MITVRNLSKRFRAEHGDVSVLRDVSLEVGAGRLFTLLGPSGCGKSTLLRCIAGLETPDEGEILINDRVVFSSSGRINVPANHRHIGIVFQTYAIWPHMTVAQNVAFPLEMRGERAKSEQAVAEILDLVGLGGYGPRSATRLSGGQQQRVALARALVGKPDVLLLDEPLSNLDAQLRDQLRVELKRIQDTVGTTTLFVTHDQSEALSLSDDIAIVEGGTILELGSPRELYDNPQTRFTAKFLGNANIIAISEHEGTTATSTIGVIRTAHAPKAGGHVVAVAVRPERIVIAASAGSPLHGSANSYRARVLSRLYYGQYLEFSLRVGAGQLIRCLAPPTLTDIAVGDEVDCSFAPENAILLVG